MKILPTKHVAPAQSAVGVGAVLLSELSSPASVSSLWARAGGHTAVRTFDRFVLGLDFLFALGAVELREGLLHRASR